MIFDPIRDRFQAKIKEGVYLSFLTFFGMDPFAMDQFGHLLCFICSIYSPVA
jgi:hypothetical protein